MDYMECLFAETVKINKIPPSISHTHAPAHLAFHMFYQLLAACISEHSSAEKYNIISVFNSLQ